MEFKCLKENNVLKINENAIVRKEGNRYMLINIATQGLHFITPIAFFVVENINGKNTLKEIMENFVKKFGVDKAEANNKIVNFIEELIKRNLVSIMEG